MFSDQNPRRSKQTQNKLRTQYRQKPIAHVRHPRPSQSNYVKTLFTMTNNKNRGDKTSIPANRIIPRQDALTQPLNTNKLVEPIKGRLDSPARARASALRPTAWWSRPGSNPAGQRPAHL